MTAQITDVEFLGVDTSDYPDFADAYIYRAWTKDRELTEAEVDEINEDSQRVYNLLLKHGI